jgi:lysyl-tRNA synthetase class 2
MTDAVQNENAQEASSPEENKLIAERRSKLDHIRLNCKANGHPNDFRREHLAGDLQAEFGEKSKEELEELNHIVAILVVLWRSVVHSLRFKKLLVVSKHTQRKTFKKY